MKHIAIDARVINSGTGTYVAKLLKYLQQIDNENRYTVLLREKDKDYWKPSAANFTTAIAEYDNYSFAEQIGFKSFLDNLAPDLVHFCMPQQPVLYKGKTVTTMHDMTLLNTYNSDKNWLVFHLKQLVGRWVFKRLAKTTDHMIAISNNTKKEYQEFSHISDEKISVIYEAGEVYPGELKPVDIPFEKFIIYVGQQPDYKNIRRLGEAHQKLLEKYPDLGLVLVGRMNPDTKANKEYFDKLNYKNIHFTGFIPDEQRDWLLKNSEVYVFPSIMEGFGLPPLEAMSYGVPVASSNASCMPEILGDAPIYFDPLDTIDMAKAVSAVIENDDNLRQQMITKGYQQAKKYSWEKMAHETLEIYKKVLNS